MSPPAIADSEHARRRILTTLALSAALAAAVVSLPGCGGQAQARLDDYLEELEFDTPLELVKEVLLGSYRVPIAARSQGLAHRESGRTWMQLKFNLYVVVLPRNESDLLDALERHRGMFDDAVLSACRSASLDELNDPRLAPLKSRLTDLAKPILGEHLVRQILLNEIVCEPL